MQFFSIFAPTIGGLLVHFFGGISVEGIRPLYFVQLIGYVGILGYVGYSLEDVDVESRVEARELVEGVLGGTIPPPVGQDNLETEGQD